jgi:hypothetical protein
MSEERSAAVTTAPTLADEEAVARSPVGPAKGGSFGLQEKRGGTVVPNESQLHNSPAKPCPSTGAQLSVTKREVKDKQVQITISNSASTDSILTALRLMCRRRRTATAAPERASAGPA